MRVICKVLGLCRTDGKVHAHGPKFVRKINAIAPSQADMITDGGFVGGASKQCFFFLAYEA
jgi:hypothetical protein